MANIEPEIGLMYDKVLYSLLDLKTKTASLALQKKKVQYNSQKLIYNEYLDNWLRTIEVVLEEDEDIYDRYKNETEKRFERIDNWKFQQDPSYGILKAEIYAHAAMANIVYGDYFAGVKKLLKANKYSKRNVEDFPTYYRNNKLVGVMNVALDMMSPILKKIAKIFKLTGDSKKGFEQLNSYLNDVKEYPGLKSEALLYYGFALKLALRDQEAYQLLNSETANYKAPALTLLLASNVTFLSGRNEEALGLIERIDSENFEVSLIQMDYLLGKIKLNHLQVDAAMYLELFLKNSKVKNFNREICSKLSHHYYMHGNTEKYYFYRKKIESYPDATTDRDREADVELKRPYLPHKELLKTRYLLSGNYFEEAEQILLKINVNTLSNQAYKVEYLLNSARVSENKNDLKKAYAQYQKAIAQGRELDEHYAAKACLLFGDLLLAKKDTSKAIRFWNEAIEIKGQDDVYFEQIDKIAKHRLNTFAK